MKKNFLLGFIAFAALAVTSCTNDDVNEFIPQGKAIEFSTYVGRDAQARGSEMNADAIKAGFGVLAYQYKTSTTYASANFMNNVEVNNSGSGWTSTDKKYWPTDDSNKIDFLAYAPFTGDASSQVSLTGKTITLTVPITVADQKDLVVATPVVGQNSGTVALTFSHMLSRIAFYAKAADTYDAEITITDISLTGKFHNKGTVDLSAADPAITGTDATVETEKTYSPELSGTALSTTLAMQNNNTDYLMLIPAAAQNLSLSITYDVEDTDGIVTNTITKPITNQAFVAGTAYAINMSISLNEVAFSVNVTAWNDPETNVPASGAIEF